MIKKAQISFICITMSILLVMFAFLGFGLHFIMRAFADRTINKVLDDSIAVYYDVGIETVQPGCIVSVISQAPSGRYEYNFWYDDAVFNGETVEKTISTALSKPYYSGNLDNIHYKIVSAKGRPNSLLFVGTDTTEIFNIMANNTTTGILIILGVYLILFYIVYRVSFFIFSPIREMINKQKHFISDASHELKTPLTIISANAEVLKGIDDNQWVKNISTQTERMSVLVNDMLTLTRIEERRKKRSLIDFDLSTETLNSALQFDTVAFEKGKTIVTDVVPDVKITADIHAFKQLLSILLDNAVKYATENTEIVVSLKKENGKTVLTVKNFGSDVPNEDSFKIFERLYRGDQSRSRESGGCGLGLSIAKSLCDANKWKISAHSRYNESMTITVVF